MRIFKKNEDVRGFRKNDPQKLLSDKSPFLIKETYNSIRTKIMFSGKGEKCPVFAVTSSMPNDGKTINCINIAISFAMTGKKILLIDGDMRNPTIYRYFGIHYKNGFSESLAGLQEEICIKHSKVENLDLVTSGEVPPNPAELLGAERLKVLLASLREKYDYIFIDTPPVEVVTDASVIANQVTGFIFVTQAGKSDMGSAVHSVELLRQLGAGIVGVILNDCNGKTQGYSKQYGAYKKNGYYQYSGQQVQHSAETDEQFWQQSAGKKSV